MRVKWDDEYNRNVTRTGRLITFVEGSYYTYAIVLTDHGYGGKRFAKVKLETLAVDPPDYGLLNGGSK